MDNGCLESCLRDSAGVDLVFVSRNQRKQFRVCMDWCAVAWLFENIQASRKQQSLEERERIANLNKRFGIE